MEVRMYFEEQDDGRLVVQILTRGEVGVGGMIEISEVLERDYDAKILNKLEGPADEHVWDLAIGDQHLALMFDPMSDIEIVARAPSDNDLVRRIGEDLEGRFRKKGVLRRPVDVSTD